LLLRNLHTLQYTVKHAVGVGRWTPRAVPHRFLGIPEATMTSPVRPLEELIRQLDTADRYAADDNAGPVPSVWQLQNALLREKASEALEAARAVS